MGTDIANVVFVTPQLSAHAVPSELLEVANLKALVVSGREDRGIPATVSPDSIVCCLTPVEIPVIPCLGSFAEAGYPILAIGSAPCRFATLVLDATCSKAAFKSALLLLKPRLRGDSLKEQNAREPKASASRVHEIVALLEHAVNLRSPGSHERADRVVWLVVHVARQLRMTSDNVDGLVLAARLREVGKIGLPDQLLYHGHESLSPNETHFYENYAALGASILRTIPEFVDIAKIVGLQLENVDGSGQVGLSHLQIPIGARILRACAAFERIEASIGPENSGEALAKMWHSANHIYDADVLAALDSIVSKRALNDSLKGEHIPLSDLRPGMTLGQSVYNPNGVRLLAYGAQVAANHIKLILDLLRESGQTSVIVLPESDAKPKK